MDGLVGSEVVLEVVDDEEGGLQLRLVRGVRERGLREEVVVRELAFGEEVGRVGDLAGGVAGRHDHMAELRRDRAEVQRRVEVDQLPEGDRVEQVDEQVRCVDLLARVRSPHERLKSIDQERRLLARD